jgi:diaminopimelate decarboxylase
MCLAGLGAEVMSPLEYELAVKAGFPGHKIVVNGLGRSEEFLRRAIDGGSYLIADSPLELKFLLSNCPLERLGVRLRAELSDRLSYRKPSKLGMSLEQLSALLAEKKPGLLHLHVTSQQTVAEPLTELLESLPWTDFKVLDFGGGWETAQDVEQEEFASFGQAFRKAHPGKTLWLEPGRALVNGAGFLLTRVKAIKTGPEGNYVIVDAPTSTMMPHKEATYRLLHPQPGGDAKFDLVDGITSMTSILKSGLRLPRLPVVGDLLVLGNCGAYTTAMSQFWAFPPIPTYFLTRNGELQPDLSEVDVNQAQEILFRFRRHSDSSSGGAP